MQLVSDRVLTHRSSLRSQFEESNTLVNTVPRSLKLNVASVNKAGLYQPNIMESWDIKAMLHSFH